MLLFLLVVLRIAGRPRRLVTGAVRDAGRPRSRIVASIQPPCTRMVTLTACASQDLIQDGVGGGLFDGQDQVVDNLPGRVTPGSSCKLVWMARRSPARQAGEAATETSGYCPLPASRPSCPGGGSCRPG
jgi:hypothetical protein